MFFPWLPGSMTAMRRAGAQPLSTARDAGSNGRAAYHPHNPGEVRHMRRAAEIACPVCSAPADAVHSGSIEYDRCRSCGGVWLDCGELEVLLALAYRTGKQAKARTPATAAA